MTQAERKKLNRVVAAVKKIPINKLDYVEGVAIGMTMNDRFVYREDLEEQKETISK